MTDLRHDTVTLLTDHGTADGSVGVIHSVVRQYAPGVAVVDLSHEVAPFDVRGGSLTLARAVQYLCPGVIIGLVDPSVGTTQRPLALEVADGAAVLLGPDNGLLAPAVGMLGGAQRAFVLDDPRHHLPSRATNFPGRDLYAPVAGLLCSGLDLAEVGTEVDPAGLMPGLVPLTTLETDEAGVPLLTGEVMWVDRFGNVQLNVDPDELEGWGDQLRLAAGDVVRTARRVTAYGELSTGEIGLMVDAHGLVAVVVDRRPASEELGLGVGDEVSFAPLSDDAPTGIRTAVTLGPRPNDPNGGAP